MKSPFNDCEGNPLILGDQVEFIENTEITGTLIYDEFLCRHRIRISISSSEADGIEFDMDKSLEKWYRKI